MVRATMSRSAVDGCRAGYLTSTGRGDGLLYPVMLSRVLRPLSRRWARGTSGGVVTFVPGVTSEFSVEFGMIFKRTVNKRLGDIQSSGDGHYRRALGID